MPDIATRIARVRENIRLATEKRGRPHDDVRLVAVSKGFGPDKIREARQAGLSLFGESRIQEARDKTGLLSREGITWHLVGHLQQNKVKYVPDLFDLVHSVDSMKLVREIDRVGSLRGRTIDILVQVNIAHDPAKFGADPDKTVNIIKEMVMLKNISVKGLMTIPPYSRDPEGSRPCYSALRELKERIEANGFPLKELSMGMSNDYEVAVEEGATLTRVGSAIFGERAVSLPATTI